MHISFDLDGTLTRTQFDHESGRSRILSRLFFPEKLRTGTKLLFDSLRRDGHQLSIYTSSMRNKNYIYYWFLSHGIRIDRVINYDLHKDAISGLPISKNPDAFGFDLHVDNEQIVAEDRYRMKCRILILHENDADWVSTVLCWVRN
jgi:FMN phosphatase YigB (HAD superfamily)